MVFFWIKNERVTLRELIEWYGPRWIMDSESGILTVAEWGMVRKVDLDTAPKYYGLQRMSSGILLRVDL